MFSRKLILTGDLGLNGVHVVEHGVVHGLPHEHVRLEQLQLHQHRREVDIRPPSQSDVHPEQ